GIVVNDFMETSDPHIFAVGECTEHRGQTFGLVAPLFDQARVLAVRITGHSGPGFSAPAPAAKLKIMGIDICSAGLIDDATPGVETVRYEDPALGAYRKLFLKDNRLLGMILVGDIEDEHTYMEWMRTGADLSELRRQLLFPPRDIDTGLAVAEMPDNETI